MDLDNISRTGKKGLVNIRFTKKSDCAYLRQALYLPAHNIKTVPVPTDLPEQSGLNKNMKYNAMALVARKPNFRMGLMMMGRTGTILSYSTDILSYILIPYLTLNMNLSNHHVHVLPEH
jgi:hypothetical protein